MTTDHFLSQSPFQCRLDWGEPGSRRAAARGDVVVLVDTLSFSTAVSYAVARGGIIYPCTERGNAAGLAERVGGVVAVARREVPEKGQYSLSPGTYNTMKPGTRVVLPSLNGSSCATIASGGPAVYLGALVNASAVSTLLAAHLADNAGITVVACGEKEYDDGRAILRMAIEDYLGAGAIISGLSCTKSPEAEVCEAAYRGSVGRLEALLWESASGRELREHGFADDVRFAAQLDSISVVPRLIDDAFCSNELAPQGVQK